jgi:hypothetical protein
MSQWHMHVHFGPAHACKFLPTNDKNVTKQNSVLIDFSTLLILFRGEWPQKGGIWGVAPKKLGGLLVQRKSYFRLI